MPFGFAGTGLEVDLTSGTVIKNDSDAEHFVKFLGGRGIATKMFVDREKFDAMISRFYKLRGLNDDGVPSAEELDRLGLQDIRLKLEQKGLL